MDRAIDKVANDSCTAGFHGDCRMHRASISIFRGEWVDGEREARLTGEESERFDLGYTGMALYEVGIVRMRTGDFDGAEDAFRRTMERGINPQPGLALLRLARGEAIWASSSIKAAVAEARSGAPKIATPPFRIPAMPATAIVVLNSLKVHREPTARGPAVAMVLHDLGMSRQSGDI